MPYSGSRPMSGRKRRGTTQQRISKKLRLMQANTAAGASYLNYGKRRLIPSAARGYLRSSGYYGRYSAGPTGQVEKKFLDSIWSGTMNAAASVDLDANLIGQGAGQSQRVGRKCIIKSIHLRGVVAMDPGADAAAADIAYLYIILDTQCNGANPAVTDIFTDVNLEEAMINMANSNRFKVLKRMTFELQATAGVTTAYNQTVREVEWYKKCDIPIEFSGATGALTEIRSNNIIAVSGLAVGDASVNYGGVCRVTFTDQ